MENVNSGEESNRKNVG